MEEKFQRALKDLPKQISYDLYEHTTIKDLVYLVQHELDLINEEPEHYELLLASELKKLKIDCQRFIKRYG